MSDNIKIVIEIPKEDYDFTKGARTARTFDEEYYVNLILNGTPLSEVLDEIKGEILGYNIRQRVSGSENFLLGYCAGMDKSAEIIDKHIGKAEEGGE